MAWSAIGAFLLAISEKLGVAVVTAGLRRLSPAMLFSASRYKLRLYRKMLEMPFLFKDMNLSARDDYVALEVQTIPDGKLKPGVNTWRDHAGPMPKFEAHRRAFIFGGGGYGKTTLLRNLALHCLSIKPWNKAFGKRGVLPIYLPLKVVRISAQFPIMEAIQGADPYFSGARGIKRIARLGSKGKLIVLLDGYDEMPYTGGFERVRRELEFIFEKNSYFAEPDRLRTKSAFEASEYWPAYRAIRESRVYMSSRWEFFEYNTIAAEPEVQRWIVKGLEDRRIELVEKIFAKYRDKTKASSGRDLDSELFLQDLVRAGDSGIVDLSCSPLFLTVICYVYVMNFDSGEESKVFSLGVSELSKTCMQLLLEDLDEYKSRDFSVAQRMAIRNRRSAYRDEKYDFLRYFSVELYRRSKGYFDEAFVSSLAADYFSSMSNSSRAVEILRGVNSSDPTNNLVKQIILSGIFVLVDRREDVKYFDFPHRKFRETLAVEYFDNPGRLDDLIAMVSEKSYAELVLVFVEQSSSAHMVVKRLLSLVVENRVVHAGDLFADALLRLPAEQAERFALDLMEACDSEPNIELPEALPQFLSPSAGTQRLLRAKLVESIEQDKSWRIYRWGRAFAKVSPDARLTFPRQVSVSELSFGSLLALTSSKVLGGDIRHPIFLELMRRALSEREVELAAVAIAGAAFFGGSEAEREAFVHWVANCASVVGPKTRFLDRIVKFVEEDLPGASNGYDEIGIAGMRAHMLPITVRGNGLETVCSQ